MTGWNLANVLTSAGTSVKWYTSRVNLRTAFEFVHTVVPDVELSISYAEANALGHSEPGRTLGIP
jgi:hypothetical protein